LLIQPRLEIADDSDRSAFDGSTNEEGITMRSLRYLNTILTVLAVLLTLNLWTQWTAPSGGAAMADWSLVESAHAQSGIPNAGAQRAAMIEEQKQTNRKLDELVGLFKSGKARVRVEAARGGGDGID
jgi:hypothetical protein